MIKCNQCFKEINPGQKRIIYKSALESGGIQDDQVYHPRCYDLSKKAPETWKEKLADWFINHIVPKTLKDEKTASRLEGFQEGYQLSGKQGQELKQIHYQLDRFEQQQAQLILQVIKDKFPNV